MLRGGGDGAALPPSSSVPASTLCPVARPVDCLPAPLLAPASPDARPSRSLLCVATWSKWLRPSSLWSPSTSFGSLRMSSAPFSSAQLLLGPACPPLSSTWHRTHRSDTGHSTEHATSAAAGRTLEQCVN
eukprot:3705832-Rhodomonas_salina.4